MTELSRALTDQPGRMLADLGRIILGERPLAPTLQRIAEIAARSMPLVDEASVTLVRNGKAGTAGSTGALAIDLDECQYETGSGPCLDAAAGTTSVVVDVADPDTPYTDFAAACRRQGVTRVLSVGLPGHQQTIGALNLYSKQPDPPDPSALELAATCAAYSAVAVANVVLYDDTARLAEQLRQALASRAVIEQAKGILMARHHYSPDAAFTALTRVSQHTNRKLRDVAGELVAGATQGELTG